MSDSSQPTTLYRLFDAEDRLLYVGITGNPGRRFQQHRADKFWWSDVARVELEHFFDRPEAATAEMAAIAAEQPVWNVIGTGRKGAPGPLHHPQWDRLLNLVPEAADLPKLSRAIGREDGSESFCANAYWYGYRAHGRVEPSLRAMNNLMVGRRLQGRVGHLKDSDQEFLTGWVGGAHAVLYEVAYAALPDCRHMRFDMPCHSHAGRLDGVDVYGIIEAEGLRLPWVEGLPRKGRYRLAS